jgi:hypothetical protein
MTDARHSTPAGAVMFPTRGRGLNMQQYAITVEGILRRVGIDPAAARMSSLVEGYGWRFQRGSALIEIYVSQHEGAGYFQVLSPIVHVPMRNLLPLYRFLLDLNLSLTAASFGTYGDLVYVYHERPLDGLDDNEAETIINLVARYADDYDDRLVSEFGARLYQRV